MSWCEVGGEPHDEDIVPMNRCVVCREPYDELSMMCPTCGRFVHADCRRECLRCGLFSCELCFLAHPCAGCAALQRSVEHERARIQNMAMTEGNNLLGKFHLDGIPPAPRGEPQIGDISVLSMEADTDVAKFMDNGYIDVDVDSDPETTTETTVTTVTTVTTATTTTTTTKTTVAKKPIKRLIETHVMKTVAKKLVVKPIEPLVETRLVMKTVAKKLGGSDGSLCLWGESGTSPGW